ncbi:MAG: hypothetical protein ACFCVF_06275 [Kineosporiaceae bacterium]
MARPAGTAVGHRTGGSLGSSHPGDSRRRERGGRRRERLSRGRGPARRAKRPVVQVAVRRLGTKAGQHAQRDALPVVGQADDVAPVAAPRRLVRHSTGIGLVLSDGVGEAQQTTRGAALGLASVAVRDTTKPWRVRGHASSVWFRIGVAPHSVPGTLGR